MTKNRFLVSILHTSHVIQTRHYQSSSPHKGHPWYKFQLHTISRTWNRRGPVHPTVRKKVHARRVKLWKRLEAKNCGEKLLNSYISRIKVINNRNSGNSQTHYKHVSHETLFSKLFYQKKLLRKTKISHRTLCFTHVTYAFRVNLHAEVSWMIGNCLLKTGAVFEDSVTATGIERITT